MDLPLFFGRSQFFFGFSDIPRKKRLVEQHACPNHQQTVSNIEIWPWIQEWNTRNLKQNPIPDTALPFNEIALFVNPPQPEAIIEITNDPAADES